MINSLLVICIGNICRSPIGEALFKDFLTKAGLNVEVKSAGLSALAGSAAHQYSQEILLAQGVDISMHRAQQFNKELAFSSDLILTMDTEQKQIEVRFPSLCGRVHRLGKWSEIDIPDPYKRPREIFEQSFHLIRQGVDEWLKVLWP